MKEFNSSFAVSGISYGEHRFLPEILLDEFKKFDFENYKFAVIRCRPVLVPPKSFYDCAEYFKQNGVYFTVLYALQLPPEGHKSQFTPEIIKKIEEIAGDYFLGEMFGETGSQYGSVGRKYFPDNVEECYHEKFSHKMPPQNFENMQEAKDFYIGFVRSMLEYNSSIGLNKSTLVEATAFSKYDLEAGITFPFLEVMPGNPEKMISFTRGAQRGYERKLWGGFIAHEWYGGFRQDDPLKYKRLQLVYNYLYMSGANFVCLESGFDKFNSFGYTYDNDEHCAMYRKCMDDYNNLLKSDKRPSNGPKCKVAFLHGNLDPFTDFMGGSTWCQFNKEEWGAAAPEHSWRILDEVNRSYSWHEGANYGDGGDDVSSAPAYGMYDVLPAESPASVMKNYDLLIFAGWNTMTDDIYSTLKEYVKEGGHLMMCASHLSSSPKRGEYKIYNNGVLSDFLGCDIVGTQRVNTGYKFVKESLIEGVMYPGTQNMVVDPIHTVGYAEFAKLAITSAKVASIFCDGFKAPGNIENEIPAYVENKYGKGVVTFLANVDYPGSPFIYPLYRAIVKELLNATHRNCPLKVLASDKIRFSFFDGDQEKLYLLNCDYNVPQCAIVRYNNKEYTQILKPLELKYIQF